MDEPMVDPEVNEEVMDDDDLDVEVEWLMAPVTPLRATMTVSSTYEIGGPSTAAIKGPSFPFPVPGLPVPPTVIEDLGTRLGNLEYKHGVVTRKMEEVSDAVVADSIALGEIHPRVATVGEQVQVVEAHTTQVVSRLEEIETRVQQVESRVDTQSSGQMEVQGHDVIVGSSEQAHEALDREEFISIMPPKRTSTSKTTTITLATIQRLITDGIAAALETQAINTNNTNRSLEPKETPVAKKKKLQRVYKLSTFLLQCNYAEENRVTFATGTLTNDALSWWNAYAQPIRIEQANKITRTKLKRHLTNKYCPRTDIKKMEDEFYDLTVKGNDLKTYIRRFQELATLCPNMVPNTEKIIEAFISGLPRSIEGNVTASKPQTFEEAIKITQRLMEQVIKHQSAQKADDHKQKFEDRINTTGNNNNHSNNHNNNNFQDSRNNNNRNHNYHHQQNRRQEAIRAYAVNPTNDSWYAGNLPLCRRLSVAGPLPVSSGGAL
nr:reverse transcriptase domain-containing protein [Tanacetum cinerariifolium]